jgi:hypothetical protein
MDMSIHPMATMTPLASWGTLPTNIGSGKLNVGFYRADMNV